LLAAAGVAAARRFGVVVVGAVVVVVGVVVVGVVEVGGAVGQIALVAGGDGPTAIISDTPRADSA
jgi:hypothetical protein